MNREQAREIAVKAYQWGSVQDVADALHAAYEAERELEAAESRVKEAAKPSPRTLVFQPMSAEDMRASARLASIKETARGIWGMYFSDGEMPLDQWYDHRKEAAMLEADADAAVDLAEALEAAFERRYGAGGGNGNSGIWVKPGDLLDAAIKPQHGGKP